MKPEPVIQISQRLMLCLFIAFAVRLGVGLWLALQLPPLSVDDYFRMHYAFWWWKNPGFNVSLVWLPAHQYLYGTVAGLSGDLILLPRLVTLLLHLGTSALVLCLPLPSGRHRVVAALWVLFTPLSFVLGTIPLAETATLFFVVLALVFGYRFRATQGAGALLGSAVALLLAGMFRYEVWPLWLVLVLCARGYRIVGVSRFLKWTVVCIPLLFPLVWILFSFGMQGRVLVFLSATREDHFGPGGVRDLLRSWMGIITLLQLSVVLAAAVTQWRSLRSSGPVTAAAFWISLGVLVIILVDGALPSQYPVRVLYMPLMLGGLLVAHWKTIRSVGLSRGIGALGAGLVTVGLVAALHTPSQVEPETRRVAAWINAQYAQGILQPEDHALISYYLPDGPGVFVLTNRPDRVHLDGMGSRCSVQFLLPFKPTCPLPEWGERVQLVVARKTTFEEEYIRYLRFEKVQDFGDWVAYRRPLGTLFPVERHEEAPDLFLR